MNVKRNCLNCRRVFSPNRNPRQVYCSDPRCQTIRKNTWRKDKLRHDNDYRMNQAKASHRWRKRHADYWRSYRESHPEYVQQNRLRAYQRKYRDISPIKASPTAFANSDALTLPSPIESGTYELKSVFANSDALLVEIKLLSTSCEQNAVCK